MSIKDCIIVSLNNCWTWWTDYGCLLPLDWSLECWLLVWTGPWVWWIYLWMSTPLIWWGSLQVPPSLPRSGQVYQVSSGPQVSRSSQVSQVSPDLPRSPQISPGQVRSTRSPFTSCHLPWSPLWSLLQWWWLTVSLPRPKSSKTFYPTHTDVIVWTGNCTVLYIELGMIITCMTDIWNTIT